MGKAFEREVRMSLKYHRDFSRGKLYWFRLMDFMDFYVLNRNIRAKHQPADFFMCRHGQAYLLEAKSTVLNRFPFDFLKDHQQESLDLFALSGGKSFLIIKHKKPGRMNDEVYIISIESYIEMKNDCLKRGKKSATWDEIAKYGQRVPLIKSQIWGISCLWTPQYNTLSSRF